MPGEEDEGSTDTSNSLQLREINLDDNGLKDGEFSIILQALNKQKLLQKVSYVNNEIGDKSVRQIAKLIGAETEADVCDLRLTAIICTKKALLDLLEAVSNAHHRLTKLRISSIALNDYVLMRQLNETIVNLP